MIEAGSSETTRAGGSGLTGLQDRWVRDAWSRDKGRRLAPLMRLVPFVRSHPVDASLGIFFMLMSSAAILGLSAAARWVIDGGFAVRDPRALSRVFLLAGGVAMVLAVTTGLRMYFLYKLGERVVADMR